jgi:4-hydroxybutyrate dehydrogenase
LNASLGIPKNLTELGVENADIERLVKSALSDPSTGGNPVEMTYCTPSAPNGQIGLIS